MGGRNLLGILVGLSLAAGCGGSPSSPSSGSGASIQAAETAVMLAMSQATRQLALTPPSGGPGGPYTMPCDGGGSMLITMGPFSPPQDNVFRTSSRIEFRDCRNQTVTINGDPYLETSGEFVLPALGGTESTSTSRMTGGMRFDNGGVQGRVRFDCTIVSRMRLVPGAPPEVSTTATGTTTFEQPLGSTPVVRPCGPA
jgi:hypothetical protein